MKLVTCRGLVSVVYLLTLSVYFSRQLHSYDVASSQPMQREMTA
jgi:hypothetical protein